MQQRRIVHTRTPVRVRSLFFSTLAVLLVPAGLVEAQGGSFRNVMNAADLVGDEINSEYWDSMGSISSDGLEMYITSDRHFRRDPGNNTELALFKVDLFYGTRKHTSQPFTGFTNGGVLSALNSTWDECTPYVSANGLCLTWFSDRDGDVGQYDIWAATRSEVKDGNGNYVAFGNPYRPMGEVSGSLEWGQSLTDDMSTLYFSSNREGGYGLFDLWQASQNPDGTSYGDAQILAGALDSSSSRVNSPFNEFSVIVSSDGLGIFWSDLCEPPFRNGQDADIWIATRASTDQPFGEVRNLGTPVNTGSMDFDFFVTRDWPAKGSQIWFTSDRPGGHDLDQLPLKGDIWVATWSPDVPFERGDVNADRIHDVSDGITILGYLFLGTGDLLCRDAADTDDSGTVELDDAVGLFNYLFQGQAAPAAPFGNCGPDLTDDDPLHCPSFEPCG